MKHLYILIITALLFTLISCEKDSDLKLPETESKIAVFGFLSPEDTITSITVVSTTPYFGDHSNQDATIITNAEVTITHNNVEYSLPYDFNSEHYSLDSSQLKIIPGDQYSLEVEVEGYPVATASIYIKESVNKTLEFIDFQYMGDESQVLFKVRWTDNANEKNYYRLTGYLNYEDTLSYYEWGERDYQILEDYSLYLYDDENWNGLVKTSNDLRCWNHYNYGTIIPVHMVLIDADEHYYLYHKTVNDHYWYGDNPFSEPVAIYNNIENGLGVFCSYRKFEIIEPWSVAFSD